MIADMARDAVAAQTEIAKLKFQLARYRRAEFGRSSEKLAREVEQLELAIETLEADQAERQAAASPAVAAAIEEAVDRQKPARRPLPEHLPREEVRHPAACTCPHCGGALRRIGEEVTETLDYVPGRFKVIRHVREKLSCRACDTVVAAPAPDHVIARGRAGAGLLAHIAISKYDDHLPLYRQAEIFAREGVELETSTLSGWVGRRRQPSTRWSTRSRPRSWPATHCMSTTRRCRCWRRAQARPRPGDCGPMSATAAVRRQAAADGAVLLLGRPQGRDRSAISKTSAASSTPTIMPGSTSCSPATGSPKPPAGPMSGASSSTSMPPPARRLPRRRLTASATSTRSKRRSPACRPSGGYRNARSARNRSPRRWPPGPQKPCPKFRTLNLNIFDNQWLGGHFQF